MKNKITSITLFLLAISFSTIVNAQSIYKRKKDFITNNKETPNNSTYSGYNAVKFDKKHSLKANLVSPFFNVLTVFYTKYINEETAMQFGASLMTDFKTNNNNEDRVLNCQAVTAEYRYLLIGTHANGSYIQPFTRFINANAAVSLQQDYYDKNQSKWVNNKINYNESCLSAGVGFLLGMQNTVKNKLLFDVYAGPAYAIQINPSTTRPSGISENSGRGSLQDLIVRGYGVRAGFCIGFLF